jgi:hypothetical protein
MLNWPAPRSPVSVLAENTLQSAPVTRLHDKGASPEHREGQKRSGTIR